MKRKIIRTRTISHGFESIRNIKYFLRRCLPGLAIIIFMLAFTGLRSVAAMGSEIPDEFRQSIHMLSSFGDRSTGTLGNKAAARYIKERLARLGVKAIESHLFAVPVIQHVRSQLTLTGSNRNIPIQPIMGNAVTPQTIPSPGITAPLVYVGSGELQHFNGKDIEGAVVLMELDSGKNWQHAADLGAKALIYVDRRNSPKILLEDKYELSPIQFPRFWIALSDAQVIFGSFENLPKGIVSKEINLISDIRWRNVTAKNIYGLIPGTDSGLRKEMIMIEAFYDSTARVLGRSPGADEACGIATLLELAGFFRTNPPKRTILFVASTGHAQTLAGMRELIWSLSSKSKNIRRMRKTLKQLIEKTNKVIKGLKIRSFDKIVENEPETDISVTLVEDAVKERIKTEADAVSRQLMQLRLQKNVQLQQNLISKLAQQRQRLRRLLWLPSYAGTGLSEEDKILLNQLLPKTLHDQEAIRSDAELQLTLLESASRFRKTIKKYNLVTAVSLHLSSQGDGFGAFNYGWLYPFKPRINRVSSYRVLDGVLRKSVEKLALQTETSGMFKDTLRPSRRRSWQSYFIDRPPLGGGS